jgi:hypothetical protein
MGKKLFLIVFSYFSTIQKANANLKQIVSSVMAMVRRFLPVEMNLKIKQLFKQKGTTMQLMIQFQQRR